MPAQAASLPWSERVQIALTTFGADPRVDLKLPLIYIAYIASILLCLLFCWAFLLAFTYPAFLLHWAFRSALLVSPSFDAAPRLFSIPFSQIFPCHPLQSLRELPRRSAISPGSPALRYPPFATRSMIAKKSAPEQSSAYSPLQSKLAIPRIRSSPP